MADLPGFYNYTISNQPEQEAALENLLAACGGPECASLNIPVKAEVLQQAGLPIDRDSLEQRMEKLYAEPDAGASDKLQIMTIFASKGLQFDHVVLPGLNRIPRGDDSKLLHWFELAGEDKILNSAGLVRTPA